jgi:hypothetical protein
MGSGPSSGHPETIVQVAQRRRFILSGPSRSASCPGRGAVLER